jgi:hypothetical protein
VAKLSDAERKRLLRKDALNTASDLAQSLGSRLSIWSIVLLFCARNQVKEDIVGAMTSTAQQQTHATQPMSETLVNSSTTATTTMAPPPPKIKIKEEPVDDDFLFEEPTLPPASIVIKEEKITSDEDDMLADMY